MQTAKIKIWLPALMEYVKSLWMTALILPVNLDILMTAPVMVTAVQSLGLVMALLTVKIKLMAVILPVMIMTAATAKVAAVVAVKTVMIVNLILRPMDLSAVIQPGMNMALIVLP